MTQTTKIVVKAKNYPEFIMGVYKWVEANGKVDNLRIPFYKEGPDRDWAYTSMADGLLPLLGLMIMGTGAKVETDRIAVAPNLEFSFCWGFNASGYNAQEGTITVYDSRMPTLDFSMFANYDIVLAMGEKSE